MTVWTPFFGPLALLTLELPSEDVLVSEVKEMVRQLLLPREESVLHPPAALYIAIRGQEVLLSDEVSLSVYNVFQKQAHLVYKPQPTVVTVLFAKRFLVEPDVTSAGLLTSLRRCLPVEQDYPSFFLATDLSAAKLTDMVPEQQVTGLEEGWTTLEGETLVSEHLQGLKADQEPVIFLADSTASSLMIRINAATAGISPRRSLSPGRAAGVATNSPNLKRSFENSPGAPSRRSSKKFRSIPRISAKALTHRT